MKAKVIKTEAEYKAALKRIEGIFDAKPGTIEGDELELLSTLVELYEQNAFPIDSPDPLAAIQFRMEQQGLKPKDLVPFLGSASRVSEVLAGQRGLSVTMMRNLVSGLGIPPKVFLATPRLPTGNDLEWNKFPFGEMHKRGWFPAFKGTLSQAKQRASDLLAAFLAPLGENSLNEVPLRQHVRSGSEPNHYALAAWQIRVETLASTKVLPTYQPGIVNIQFVQELARLSYFNEGPKLAKEFLNKSGIHLVVERHLPQTFLDGAAMKLANGAPVIALTLRFDRLDNFWFTVAHEVAHLALHLDKGKNKPYFDDVTSEHNDTEEREADEFACEGLIPKKVWRKAGISGKCSAAEVRAFAEKLRISPAIPAGRIRFEKRDYKLFSHLVGTGEVRRWFEQNKEQETLIRKKHG